MKPITHPRVVISNNLFGFLFAPKIVGMKQFDEYIISFNCVVQSASKV